MSASKSTETKPAPKPQPKHDEGKDLRRAYEHQGRVKALRPALGNHGDNVDTVTKLAEQELLGKHYKDAADLFRAAEHLSFGLLATAEPATDKDATLTTNLTSEFERTFNKAEEHWKKTDALATVYGSTVSDAKKAFDDGHFLKALELGRAAEALAHVHVHGKDEAAKA